tara:strand:- start:1986 stop:2468 length:483 start_codon:yes stop_codon:yes gene_type:complete
MPNANNNPADLSIEIEHGEKVRTFFKHPGFDARIAVYIRPDQERLFVRFMSQGTSPDGTKRNPDHRKAFVALLPGLLEAFGLPLAVRYGSSKTAPCYHNPTALGVERLFVRGRTFKFDMVFDAAKNFDCDGDYASDILTVLLIDLELVVTKNKADKQTIY